MLQCKIGSGDGAPAATWRSADVLYHLYELTHAAVAPWRAAAHVGRLVLNNPVNPFAYSYPAKAASAALEVFEGLTQKYGKPEFGIAEVSCDGVPVAIEERVVMHRPFCHLLHFERDPAALSERQRRAPRVLVVAPLSGHYATLLRGTVRTLLEDFDVWITDWIDAREVPLVMGDFDLDHYIDYVLDFIRHLGPDLHVIAVCQPGPAVLSATALLAAADHPCQPASVTLMGSPIDSRRSPTEPNRLAKTRQLAWFEHNVIMNVPFPHAGFMRRVYPGFLQLTGFMTMNLDRHLDAHKNLFRHLVEGDGDSVAGHRKFYDEYLAVMDLPAEYYLQTLRVVFQEHRLAEGGMVHRGERVDPARIRRTALMTVEGENDDISGIGQTQAAHDLCTGIPAHKRIDYIQAGVGHYGVFNGSRWRAEIAPRIRDFIHSNPRLGA
jgi:poly(3-hydroxybutyrate) depolymerase